MTQTVKRDLLISLLLFAVSFTYYYMLSAKIWTWIYI